MRIGVLLTRVLLIAGIALAVASPSWVGRRTPTFAELFERFRSNDVAIAYSESVQFGEGNARVASAWTRTIVLTKSSDSYLRLDWSYPSLRVRARIGARDRSSMLVTPTSAAYCTSSIQTGTSPMYCYAISPEGRDNQLEQAAGMLILPLPLRSGSVATSKRTLRWSRQDDREVIGIRSSCYVATAPDEGTFTLCLADRGELMYASVERGRAWRAIEATSVDHSVDMSVFDTKKFLDEN